MSDSTAVAEQIETAEEQQSSLPQHRQSSALSNVNAVNPMELLSMAVSQGAEIEKLEQLMGLQERWEANQARKAFDAAIAAARSEIKPIAKTGFVDYEGQGGRTQYSHETLDGIAKAVDPILGKHGLSYRFRSKQEGSLLEVTCIIAHEAGHSEETTLSGGPDTSGKKNQYQQIGSAATYLQRYTLKLALGLSAAKDDDAQAVNNDSQEVELISEDQVAELVTMINNSGFPLKKFCEIGRVNKLHEIPANRFKAAKNRLAQEIGQMAPGEQQ